jgi:hypothetical protein
MAQGSDVNLSDRCKTACKLPLTSNARNIDTLASIGQIIVIRKLAIMLVLALLTAAWQTPPPEPAILSFTATPDRVSPVDGEFVVSWEAANADAVTLSWYSAEDGFVNRMDLPLVGSMTLSAQDITFDNGHVTVFMALTEPGSYLALPNAATGGYYTTAINITLETPIEIVNFSANPVPVVPGAVLTLDWDVRGAESIRVSGFDRSMIPSPLFSDLDTPVPMQGRYTFDVPGGYIGRKVAYELYAIDANGVWVRHTIDLDVVCQIPDHIAPLCPSSQVERTVRWQPFDGGMLLAYEEEGQSQPVIQLLLNNGRTVTDGGTGEPWDGTLMPPPDHFPSDPLFDTWLNAPIQQALGYATAPLQTYSTVLETVLEADHEVIHTPVIIYLRWVDGRVMEINNSRLGRWQFVGG